MNRLSVTDDWNVEKMDGHLKRNVKKYDIQQCLDFFYLQTMFLIDSGSFGLKLISILSDLESIFMELSQCYDLSRILLSWC